MSTGYGRRLVRHICQWCGTGFYREYVSTRPAKCCSRSCKAKAMAADRGLPPEFIAAVDRRRGIVDADKLKRRRQRRNAKYADASTASRHRYIWTGPELELANRADLTAAEIAAMIGRTIHAVKHARRNLQIDSRKQAFL